MKSKYYLVSSIVYSLIALGKLGYIFLWIVGMGESAELPSNLIILIVTVLMSITLLIVFFYYKNKSVSTKVIVGLFSIVFVFITFIWLLYSFLMYDMFVLGVLTTILFTISGILLLYSIINEISIEIKNDKAVTNSESNQ